MFWQVHDNPEPVLAHALRDHGGSEGTSWVWRSVEPRLSNMLNGLRRPRVTPGQTDVAFLRPGGNGAG